MAEFLHRLPFFSSTAPGRRVRTVECVLVLRSPSTSFNVFFSSSCAPSCRLSQDSAQTSTQRSVFHVDFSSSSLYFFFHLNVFSFLCKNLLTLCEHKNSHQHSKNSTNNHRSNTGMGLSLFFTVLCQLELSREAVFGGQIHSVRPIEVFFYEICRWLLR